jgi:hypothetical protein
MIPEVRLSLDSKCGCVSRIFSRSAKALCSGLSVESLIRLMVMVHSSDERLMGFGARPVRAKIRTRIESSMYHGGMRRPLMSNPTPGLGAQKKSAQAGQRGKRKRSPFFILV